MDDMTTEEASQKWGISIRETERLCAAGRVDNAYKSGSVWMIPSDADKPSDARIKNGKYLRDFPGQIDLSVWSKSKRDESVGVDAGQCINSMKVLSQTGYDVKEQAGKIYDFADLFCGCGGMSYGFHEMERLTGKFRFAGAFDVDRYALDSYAVNYRCRPVKLDLALAQSQDISSALDLNPSDELILIGCPPLQSSSSEAGEHGASDAGLVEQFARLAVSLRPKLIIMQTARSLKNAGHGIYYESFREIIESAGYHITLKTLNTADYGTAQVKHLSVLLAGRDFVPSLPDAVLAPGEYRTVRDAIGYLPSLRAGAKDPDDPMHAAPRHRKATLNLMKKVPKDGGSISGRTYARLCWDRPSGPITAKSRTPSAGRFVHPVQNRGLSVREAALIAGFPPDFMFEGPLEEKFKQIGNAVPPIFSVRLAAHVLMMLKSQEK